MFKWEREHLILVQYFITNWNINLEIRLSMINELF